MCINLETSIIALSIGMIASLKLINDKDKETVLIGKFIMFYTMVQLFEAIIYYNNSSQIPSMLLLLNLGFQGLFFILLLNDIIPLKKIYIYITVLVSIIITYKALHPEFKKATTDGGMKWNFNDTIVSSALFIMYITMFLAVIENNKDLDKINKMGILLFGTLLVSYVAPNIIMCDANRPSIWCLSSAIIAPLIIFL